MATNIRSLKVFVSSPGDVEIERKIIDEVAQKVDMTLREMFDTTLEVCEWEKMLLINDKDSLASFQDIINEKIMECDIFVLLLGKRKGSKEKGFTETNTKREINVMLDRIEKGERVFILTYYKTLNENTDPGPQEKGVRKLRADLQESKIIHNTYSDIINFERRLTHDLFKTVLRYLWDTPKRKATKLFWQVGEAVQPTSIKLAIIYPPIDRSYTEMEKPDLYWHNRLAPNIVFEDYKALQKIQKSMRMIGLGDYRIFTTSSIPKDFRYMNRVWVCLPRNVPAQNQLSIYEKENRNKFRIIPRVGKKPAEIKWKNSSSNEEFFTIKSPLSSYLSIQRGEKMKGGEWDGEMERIVVKDYAIIARFRDNRLNIDARPDNPLYDYFLAGIRGLGTWGATWFLDRRTRVFLDYTKYNDIQLLLEVIYWDGKIIDVRDVSNESPSYFKDELKKGIINNHIKELRHY